MTTLLQGSRRYRIVRLHFGGWVAQLVEHCTENAGVVSSILTPATNSSL